MIESSEFAPRRFLCLLLLIAGQALSAASGEAAEDAPIAPEPSSQTYIPLTVEGSEKPPEFLSEGPLGFVFLPRNPVAAWLPTDGPPLPTLPLEDPVGNTLSAMLAGGRALGPLGVVTGIFIVPIAAAMTAVERHILSEAIAQCEREISSQDPNLIAQIRESLTAQYSSAALRSRVMGVETVYRGPRPLIFVETPTDYRSGDPPSLPPGEANSTLRGILFMEPESLHYVPVYVTKRSSGTSPIQLKTGCNHVFGISVRLTFISTADGQSYREDIVIGKAYGPEIAAILGRQTLVNDFTGEVLNELYGRAATEWRSRLNLR